MQAVLASPGGGWTATDSNIKIGSNNGDRKQQTPEEKEEGKRELMGTMLKLNGRTEKKRQKTRRSGAVVEPKKVRVEDGGSGRRS